MAGKQGDTKNKNDFLIDFFYGTFSLSLCDWYVIRS